MKRFWPTLVFLLIVLGLALYAYFGEYQGKISEEKERSEAQRILKIEPQAMTALEIQNKGALISLAKENGTWQLKQPVSDLADEGTVESSLKSLSSDKAEEVESGGLIDWKIFGLEAPKNFVTVKTSEKSYKIHVSESKSVDGKFYGRLNDDTKVLLLDYGISSLINKTAKDWRNKQIVRHPLELLSIDVTNDTPTNKENFTLIKNNDQWSLKEQPKATLDLQVINEFVEKIRDLRASDFLAEEKSARTLGSFTLNKPLVKIRILTQSPKSQEPSGTAVGPSVPFEILLGAEKDGKSAIVVSDLPTVFGIYKATADSLVRSKFDFRDKREPFKFVIGDIREINYRNENLNFHFKKQDKGWVLAQPDPQKDVDVSLVESLLSQLTSITAEKFISPSSGKGLDSPKGRVVLRDEKGESVFSLDWGSTFKEKIGSTPTDLIYVKTNKSNEVLGVRSTSLSMLPKTEILKAKIQPTDKVTNNKMSSEAGSKSSKDEKQKVEKKSDEQTEG